MDLLKSKLHLIALFFCIAVFVLFKIPHLPLPLHWDEMGVYGRSVQYLIDHKITPMPNALDPELSRGHPMLLVFLTSSFVNLMGGDVILYGHIFMLLVSIALILVTYLIGTEVKNKWLGLASAVLLIVQPVFIAQANLILPEVMLGLFTALSLLFYLKKRFILYFLSCSLAMLSKETAIILPISYFVAEIINTKKVINWANFKFLIPYFTFGLFLVVQKLQNGWFFFPYHTGLINLDINYVANNSFGYFYFIFVAQGRFLLSIFFLYGLIHGGLKPLWNTKIVVFWVIFVVMFGFSVVNFYMTRYLILVFPIFLISVLYLAFDLVNKKWFGVAILACVIAPLFFMENKDRFNYDSDLGYIKQTENLDKTINYLESCVNKSDIILCEFPTYFAVENKKNGYLNDSDSLKRTLNIKDNWTYWIKTTPGESEINTVDVNQIVLLKTFKDNFAETKIYKRKKQ